MKDMVELAQVVGKHEKTSKSYLNEFTNNRQDLNRHKGSDGKINFAYLS